MDVQIISHVVVDEAELPESVHEEADPRTDGLSETARAPSLPRSQSKGGSELSSRTCAPFPNYALTIDSPYP